MRPFGCPVTILNTLDSLDKFDGKVDKGFLVGYSVNSKAFRVFNSRTRIVQDTLYVNFLENKSNITSSGPTWLFNIDSLTRTMNYQSVNAGNQTNPSAGFQDTFDAEKAGEEINQQYVLFPVWSSGSINPQNYDGDAAFDGKDHNFDAKKPDAQSRKQDDTTKKEAKGKKLADVIHSDDENDVGVEADFKNLETSITKVWVLVDLPHGKRSIGTKWVYRNKKDERGIVVRNKARLVVQGHTYEEGIDYEEVFAPVARIEAIRLFLAYASFMGFMVYQIDVKSAFLYVTIDEEVYVCQSPGFEDPDHPDKVYKVDKALYGLHQAPRACQDKYVAEILRKFRLTEGKLASTPIDTEKPLLKDPDGDDVDIHTYRLMIVKRIFRYLKDKPHLGLWYPKDLPFDLVAYSDSDYAGESMDRKSTTRGWQFLGCRLISWQCKNQTVVASSSTEAKYVAAASCCAQVLWIQNQLLDYGFIDDKVSAVKSKFSAFWNTVAIKQVNDVTRLQALVDKKKVVVTEAAEGDLSTHTTKYASPTLTQKVFANMRRAGKGFSRVETPLFEGMLVGQEIEEEGDADEHVEDFTAGDDSQGDDTAAHGEVPIVTQEPSIPSPTLTIPSSQLPQDIPSTSQGRMIDEMDKDDVVVLMDENEEDKKVKEAKVDESAQEDEPDEVQEVVDVVTTAKLIIEVVTAASETFTAASAIISDVEPQVPAATITAASTKVAAAPSRRRKGVVIRVPEDESTTSSIISTETKSKDKGKRIMVQEPKPLKKKQQIKMDEEYARKFHAEINKYIDWDVSIDYVKLKAKEDLAVERYQVMKRKSQSKAQARKNMMMYLKNVVGFKLGYFKGMSYDDIRPIFEAKFNSNSEFLLKTKEQIEDEENRALQSINETPTQKAAKMLRIKHMELNTARLKF
nr:copia protein [Tanacetum cinerariifolium]